MRSLLVLAVLVTVTQAFSVFQNPPCSGTTPCLINCVVNSRCPIFNPSKPILLAGPTCDRFYKCESGRACETLCPGGTHFNIREQVCDWPHRACCDPSIECRPDPCGPNGDCGGGGGIYPPPPPPPPPPTPVVPEPPCSGTGICASNCPVDNRCPMFDGLKPTLLPGQNCGVYAKCVSGRACPMACPAGLHFNYAKQICDWPFQACCDPNVECRPDPCGPSGDCGGGGGIYPPPPPPPPPPTPVVPEPPCSGTGICASNCPVDNRCPMFDGLKPTLLPGQNCGVYAKCVSGRACPMACPAGLHFNYAKQICDWPFQACCDPSVECRPNLCPPGAFGCGQNNNYNNHYNNNNNNWMWG
ncbi:probable chitinase 10 [Anopheles maculipalpis]|uniref:probable chitinase 10 n=1 Tax=Anopheles maculipalpis TaxID=1496333 RepID=UPI002159474A|nr:probable chitinase 10 [Anopheles maculipalpis]